MHEDASHDLSLSGFPWAAYTNGYGFSSEIQTNLEKTKSKDDTMLPSSQYLLAPPSPMP
jgi:hypothetical protein